MAVLDVNGASRWGSHRESRSWVVNTIWSPRDERNCRRVDALGGADLAKQLACSTT